MNGPVQARQMLVMVLVALVVAMLPGRPGQGRTATFNRASLSGFGKFEGGSRLVGDGAVHRRGDAPRDARWLRIHSGRSGAEQGTAIASVKVTTDVCPNGVSNPVTATRRLNRSVSRRATVRNRTAASRSLATHLALVAAKDKARERMRKALIVAATRQARDEAAEVSKLRPVVHDFPDAGPRRRLAVIVRGLGRTSGSLLCLFVSCASPS